MGRRMVRLVIPGQDHMYDAEDGSITSVICVFSNNKEIGNSECVPFFLIFASTIFIR